MDQVSDELKEDPDFIGSDLNTDQDGVHPGSGHSLCNVCGNEGIEMAKEAYLTTSPSGICSRGGDPACNSIDRKTSNSEFYRDNNSIAGMPADIHTSQGMPTDRYISDSIPQNRQTSQGIPTNGHTLQGMPTNGHTLQGIPTNGHTSQGIPTNGHTLQGMPTNGQTSQGIPTNGHSLQIMPTHGAIVENHSGLCLGNYSSLCSDMEESAEEADSESQSLCAMNNEDCENKVINEHKTNFDEKICQLQEESKQTNDLIETSIYNQSDTVCKYDKLSAPTRTDDSHKNCEVGCICSGNTGMSCSSVRTTNCNGSISSNVLRKGDPKLNDHTAAESIRPGKASLVSRFRLMEKLRVLKNPSFLLYCFLLFTIPSANTATFIFLPGLAEERGVSDTRAAILLSVIGACNAVGTLVIGYIFDVPFVRRHRRMFHSCLGLLLGMSVFTMAFMYDFIAMGMTAGWYGFALAGVMGQRATALSQYVTSEQLPSAFGFMIVFQGLGNLAGLTFQGVVLY